MTSRFSAGTRGAGSAAGLPLLDRRFGGRGLVGPWIEDGRQLAPKLARVELELELALVSDRDRAGLLGHHDDHGVGLLREAERRAVTRPHHRREAGRGA